MELLLISINTRQLYDQIISNPRYLFQEISNKEYLSQKIATQETLFLTITNRDSHA